MKIGITCYPTYGGSGTIATELGKSLATRGHQVHFITTALPYRLSTFVENVFYHEVEVFNYPLFDYAPYSLSLASKMAQVALREDLDLLHVHYAVPHATSAYLAQRILEPKKRLPVVTTLHGTDITLVGNDPSYYEITRFSIDKSDSVTSVSEYLKNQTRYRFAISRPIEVIPNFVDTDLFHPRTLECQRLGFAAPEDKVLMHISNFRPVKRIPDIISVFEAVSKHIPARLVLVGSGPERERAQAMVDEKGLRDRVHFLGLQDNVQDILPCADLYLLLSEHESFGLTSLEAMSCGVPVIGTSGSGMDEYLGDCTAGLLFKPGDIRAMSEGALNILTNPGLAKRMGEAGRDRAASTYCQEVIITRYEDLYSRVLG